MFTKSKNVTDYLFVTPNFLTGVGSILNLGGNYFEYNQSLTANDADVMAIENDFWVIGNDLNDAIELTHNTYLTQTK